MIRFSHLWSILLVQFSKKTIKILIISDGCKELLKVKIINYPAFLEGSMKTS